MDIQEVLYWLRSTKFYLEAERHKKMYSYESIAGIDRMIEAVDSAIDHYDSEIRSYRNYDVFVEKGEFPW